MAIPDVALVLNTEERTPLVLVLDRSGSMGGEKIDALNEGLKTLEQEIKSDTVTAQRGRVLVVQFGGNDEVDVGQWQDAKDFAAPTLVAGGATPTGLAVQAALSAIEAQKAEMKSAGINYKRPILLLMSDGDPTDDWDNVAAACRAAESANKVTVFPLAVGSGANIDILKQFTNKGAAIQLTRLKFNELFIWLSNSVKAVSQAAAGQPAQVSSIDSFGTIGTSTN
jgi:uncharacterized protein YegL